MGCPRAYAGAVCGSAARTDLCGGRGVILVPTATQEAAFRHAGLAVMVRKNAMGSSSEVTRSAAGAFRSGSMAGGLLQTLKPSKDLSHLLDVIFTDVLAQSHLSEQGPTKGRVLHDGDGKTLSITPQLKRL